MGGGFSQFAGAVTSHFTAVQADCDRGVGGRPETVETGAVDELRWPRGAGFPAPEQLGGEVAGMVGVQVEGVVWVHT